MIIVGFNSSAGFIPSLMSQKLPRLLLVPGRSEITPEQRAALERAFTVVDAASASLQTAGDDWTLVQAGANAESTRDGSLSLYAIASIGSSGEVLWTSPAFESLPDAARLTLITRAGEQVANWRASGESTSSTPNVTKIDFTIDDHQYDAMLVPVTEQGEIRAYGLVRHHLSAEEAARALAIDEAGLGLLQFNADELAELNSFQRLKRLESQVVRFVSELLGFQYFEVRHLSRKSRRLELVITQGIKPLKIGEYLYAEAAGQGISGYVATTGRSYRCPDTSIDSRYREGLDGAASSLTVPLMIAGRVTGTLNAESLLPDAFSEIDRRLAERFGVYLAIALNMLDLLVADRCATRENIAQSVQDEIARPLDRIRKSAAALLADAETSAPMRRAMEEIIESADTVTRRVESCRSGTRSLLGVDQTLQQTETITLLQNKQVLIADDDSNIREEMESVLKKAGCQVVACTTGNETIEALDSARAGEKHFDLVVTDVNMPDRNGYEVFCAAKNVSDKLPVILMTGFGYDPHHSIVRASQEGLQCFLFKPFRAQQLLEEVRRALVPATEKSTNGQDLDSPS